MAENEWDQYRDAQKKRREDRLPVRQRQIEALEDDGYQVEKKTEFHYRINGVIDLYPIHNRWHNIKTQKRGGAKNLAEYVKKHYKKA